MNGIVRIHMLACAVLRIDPEEEINAPCGFPNLLLPIGFQRVKPRSIGHLNAGHRYV